MVCLKDIVGNAVFKFEPFVLHVQSRSLSDAQLLVSYIMLHPRLWNIDYLFYELAHLKIWFRKFQLITETTSEVPGEPAHSHSLARATHVDSHT